jgi:hypothetical protein
MNERTKRSGGSILQRWSRLKSEAREKANAALPARPPEAAAAPAGVVPSADGATALQAQPIAAATAAENAPSVADGSLPPVESLTLESDFSAFMHPKVDEALKRRALKQLFRDPHFNIMDGLDVYIDDYSKPDPIPPEIVRQMVQGRYVFDPPPTRINAHGHVEDMPEEEIAATEGDAMAALAADTDEGRAGAPPRLPGAEVDPAAVLPLPNGDASSTAPDADSESGAGPTPAAMDPAAR